MRNISVKILILLIAFSYDAFGEARDRRVELPKSTTQKNRKIKRKVIAKEKGIPTSKDGYGLPPSPSSNDGYVLSPKPSSSDGYVLPQKPSSNDGYGPPPKHALHNKLDARKK